MEGGERWLPKLDALRLRERFEPAFAKANLRLLRWSLSGAALPLLALLLFILLAVHG
jgi:hypothetical protein